MKKKLQITCFVMALLIVAAVTVYAAAGDYNSEEDPLVTVSYLEQQISTLQNEIESLKSGGTGTSPSTPSDANGYTYEIVLMNKGDKLFVSSPSDIVLRSGAAVVISPFVDGNKQGINDYTTGGELLNGDAVTINHFLLIPRGDDGRGIEITSEYAAYVMVRGEYKVVSASE